MAAWQPPGAVQHQDAANGGRLATFVTASRFRPPIGRLAPQPHAAQRASERRAFHRNGATDIVAEAGIALRAAGAAGGKGQKQQEHARTEKHSRKPWRYLRPLYQ